MQALVVSAHPSGDGIGQRSVQVAQDALRRAGPTVTCLDLAEIGFQPRMSLREWEAYQRLEAALEETTAAHAGLVASCDVLVFVFPCRNWGVPALLKGWLERVLVPGVAFELNERTARIEGRLGHVQHLIGVTTSTLPRWQIRLFGDAGRRTVIRSLRLLCSWRTRATWMSLYNAEQADDDRQRAFLAHVDGLARLRDRRRIRPRWWPR